MSAIADILALVNSNPNKTLDELFLEHLGLGASDAPLKVLLSTIVQTSPDERQHGDSFSPTVDGNLRVILTIRDNDRGSTREDVYVGIYEDNIRIALKQIDYTDIITTPKEFSLDFNVTKGKTYHVTLTCSDDVYNANCDEIKVCGSISDPTLIE